VDWGEAAAEELERVEGQAGEEQEGEGEGEKVQEEGEAERMEQPGQQDQAEEQAGEQADGEAAVPAASHAGWDEGVAPVVEREAAQLAIAQVPEPATATAQLAGPAVERPQLTEPVRTQAQLADRLNALALAELEAAAQKAAMAAASNLPVGC
jgi:hypothetical protein